MMLLATQPHEHPKQGKVIYTRPIEENAETGKEGHLYKATQENAKNIYIVW